MTTLLLAAAASAGCAPPNATNIALRKRVQTQQEEIDRLKRQVAANAAGPSTTTRPTTGPTLTPEQTEALITTHGIRLGRLTRLDAQGLSVHVVPTDVDDEPLKAAGSIAVDAFDLADGGRSIGHWSFDGTQTRAMWSGQAMRYEYVVPCPLSALPEHELTAKVTFVDALTGRSFSQQTAIAAPAK